MQLESWRRKLFPILLLILLIFLNSLQKTPLGRTRYSWDDIKMDIKDTGYEDVGRNHMAQDIDQWRTLVNTVIITRVP
jgi:hypothetical protein